MAEVRTLPAGSIRCSCVSLSAQLGAFGRGFFSVIGASHRITSEVVSFFSFLYAVNVFATICNFVMDGRALSAADCGVVL